VDSALIGVDATRPWFAALGALRELVHASDPLVELNRLAAARGVTTETGRPLVFVDEADASPGVAYEAHIAATGRVPTRNSRHDLFNALVWLAFPRTKARLNALQAEAIARDGVAGGRGALRDAATVFDENGALLIAEDPFLAERVRARDWREAFVARREEWERVRVFCFGHALMDKLVRPYKAITAHVLVVEAQDGQDADADAAQTIDRRFAVSALMPLPVLGIPGWWPANADPTFYEDRSVFRVQSWTRATRHDSDRRTHA